MQLEEKTTEIYNRFAGEYYRVREEGSSPFLYNNFIELPEMIIAVGDVQGKRLLDPGCGGGLHAQAYCELGAMVEGIDQSEEMIQRARRKCPQGKFIIGDCSHLPYQKESFGIATASFVLFHIADLEKALSEVKRVLKPGGRFLFSTLSPLALSRERYENEEVKIYGIGHLQLKATGETIPLGRCDEEGIEERELLPGMKIHYYRHSLKTYVRSLAHNGLTLTDYIECKPSRLLREIDSIKYAILNKVPAYCIYAAEARP